MIFEIFELSGTNQKELNVELRFLLATARADGRELVKFVTRSPSQSRDEERLRSCILRVLRALRNDGVFQFFIFDKELATEVEEAEYLRNKYSELITKEDLGYISLYVKM